MNEKSNVQPQLEIQRVYVKDLSLEVPSAPQIFREEWRPEIAVDLDVKHNPLEENIYDVVLSVSVTAKMKDKTVFIAEVQQAGIFFISGFDKAQMDQLLNAYAPTALFPYARESVSDLVARASFPQLNLAPVNFEALYVQQQAAGKVAEKQADGEVKH